MSHFQGELKKFAVDLLNNDSKVRNKALLALKDYLGKHSDDFQHEDYFILWEALVFALWSIDGVKPFQELSSYVSQLLVILPSRCIGVWFDAIWFTLKREWNKLDRYRLDKFQMLIRIILAYTFSWLKEQKWNQTVSGLKRFLSSRQGSKQDIQVISSSWEYGLLESGSGFFAVGVTYQFLDVFLEELYPKVQDDEVESRVDD